GTSDFAAIALGPSHRNQTNRRKDVFATTGIKVGGTDFDKDFSLHNFMSELGFETKIKLDNNSETTFPREYFDKLSSAFYVNELYNYTTIAKLEHLYQVSLERPKIGDLLHVIKTENGHVLITEVETCKKGLSYTSDYTFRKNKAFNLCDDLFMTEQDLQNTISEFNEKTKNYLVSKDAQKLLDEIKLQLEDAKKQYVDGNQNYDILFGNTETYDIQQCKQQIDNVVYASLEKWINTILSISLNDIKEEFAKHERNINTANIDKIYSDINRFREIGKFEITFNPNYYEGYKIFNDFLQIKLPEDKITRILEFVKNDIVGNIDYKEALFKTLEAELSFQTIANFEKEIVREGVSKNSRLYKEKLYQRTVEEYKRQKGSGAYYEKHQAALDTLYKSKINSFIISIKTQIFVECKLLGERNTLLKTIQDLIHVIELTTFNLPSLDELTTIAINKGAIYKDKVISKSDFEASINKYMPRLKNAVNECIKKSGKDKSDFQYLIMTGGSSRIPMIRKSIRECFDKDIKVVCEDLSTQKDLSHKVMENIDTPDDISVGLCMYAMNLFK
ncbi:MAG: Hsp70 family protein, partial [Alphaproteobacteria bacterium]|nr:Hsp70 family protein [Alphaproteobacteria bacterium]